MRQALGGSGALDAVTSFSARGSRTLNTPIGMRRLQLEWFVLMPDHLLDVQRDSTTGPISTDIVYYNGIAGSRVIRKTDSTLPFPETRYADDSPAAVAARERAAVLRWKHELARLSLALFGASAPGYPLQFAYVGVEHAEGKNYDVIDATSADGFRCRLHVDATTHLPAMLTWMDEIPHVITTTSTSVVATQNGRIVSQTPPDVAVPVIPSGNRGAAPKRWIFSNFKAEEGINWPRLIEEEFNGKNDEIRLGGYKINPKIDARKFDVK